MKNRRAFCVSFNLRCSGCKLEGVTFPTTAYVMRILSRVAGFILHTSADKTRYPYNPYLGISMGLWAQSVGLVDPPDVTDQGNFIGPLVRRPKRRVSRSGAQTLSVLGY